MADLPEVSVVVPTRDRPELLRVACASALAQRGVRIELIVVDEASARPTVELLDRLSSEDPRVRVVRHDQPRRLPGARNAGAAVAAAPWIAFLDDDDVWHPDKLAKQLAAVSEQDRRWSCTGAVLFDERFQAFFVSEAIAVAERLNEFNSVPAGGSGVLVERTLLKQVGGFDESLAAAEDWECWLRLAHHGEPAVVPDTLTGYRVASTSMSHDAARMATALHRVAEIHPAVTVESDPGGNARRVRYLALQLARSGQRRAAAKQLISVRPLVGIHVVLACWVLVTGQTWERPTWLRSKTAREQLRLGTTWLQQARDAGARL